MTGSGHWREAIAAALSLGATTRWTEAGSSAWAMSWRIDDASGTYFVKVARAGYANMAASEVDGLAALRAANLIAVPDTVASGACGDTAFVALAWLDLQGLRDPAALGAALATLHRKAPPDGETGRRFGWRRDNWIGATPQHNAWSDDWCAFVRDRRLAPQLERAARNGHGAALARDGERLLAMLPSLLRGHDPSPSLLHGDLWSGNAGALADGTPVIFDPAVYVGDREADLAMTELFGGFPHAFYDAYRAAWPLDDGYPVRRTLYNLYHLLNHLNLFGATYLVQVRQSIAALAAEAR